MNEWDFFKVDFSSSNNVLNSFFFYHSQPSSFTCWTLLISFMAWSVLKVSVQEQIELFSLLWIEFVFPVSPAPILLSLAYICYGFWALNWEALHLTTCYVWNSSWAKIRGNQPLQRTNPGIAQELNHLNAFLNLFKILN